MFLSAVFPNASALGRTREGVRVLAHEERPVRALAPTVVADGLGDGQDVGFVEGAVQRGAAVPAGAEADPMARVPGVGLAVVVLLLQLGRVHQHVLGGGLARTRRNRHVSRPCRTPVDALRALGALAAVITSASEREKAGFAGRVYWR